MSSRSLRDTASDMLVAVPGGRELVRLYAFHRSRLHVVSYPKSGRTWLRYAMGVAMCSQFGLVPDDLSDLLEPSRLARLDRRIPNVRFSHDDNPHWKAISQLGRDKRRYRSKHVVFLARDPRDVVVSSYYQHTRRAQHFDEPGFDGSMPDFIRHPVFGIATIVEFMNIWARNRAVPRRFRLLRYEDMAADPRDALVGVLEMAGIVDPDRRAVERAVEASRFDNMQGMERADALGSDRIRPTVAGDADSFKVRRGMVGGYVDEFDPDDKAFVDRAINRLDPLFGYQAAESE